MNTFIILLRGINVSGQKKVPMAELRTLLSNLGFKKVTTYIQSGNIVLQSEENKSHDIETIIKKALLSHFGFEVSTLVLSSEKFKACFDNCPFPEDKKSKSYFTLLHSVPESELIDAVSNEVYPNEEFIITNTCVYFYSEKGYGRAKCNTNFFERKLKITATTRNYNTMVKLLSLSSELS